MANSSFSPGLIILLAPVLLLLTGCVFLPKVDEEKVPKCQLYTRELTVGALEFEPDFGNVQSGSDFVAVLTGYAAIGAVSGIVSGSIVVTGNTIHWIEREGTCKEGVIKEAIDELYASLASLGGWLAGSKEELLDWFNRTTEKRETTDQGNENR